MCRTKRRLRYWWGVLVARTRESRGRNVIGLQSSGGEDETDVNLLMWGAGNEFLERELSLVCSKRGREEEWGVGLLPLLAVGL